MASAQPPNPVPTSSPCLNQHHKAPSFTDLPNEVLEKVLLPLIHDLVSPTWLPEPDAGNKILTQPIAQVCRVLRARFFALISRFVVWTRLQIDLSCLARDRSSGETMIEGILSGVIPDSVCLFRNLTHHVDGKLPNLTIRLYGLESAQEEIDDEMEPYVLIWPFSFEVLLHFFTHIRAFLMTCDRLIMGVAFENMESRHVQKHLFLVRSGLIMLGDTYRIESLTDLGDSTSLQDIYFLDGQRNVYSRQSLWRNGIRRFAVLDSSRALELNDFVEEAGLLLLWGAWLKRDLTRRPVVTTFGWLDSPDNPDHLFDVAPDRPLSVNQLPCLHFYIERTTCVYYAHFWRKYGQKWCSQHSSVFKSPLKRLSRASTLPWLGMSMLELASFHYTQALVCELDAKSRQDCSNPRTLVPRAASEAYYAAYIHASFAAILDPQNDEYVKVSNRVVGRLDKEAASRAQAELIERFISIPEENTSGTTSQILWAGDCNIVNEYGGRMEFVRSIKAAREDVVVPPEIRAWADKIDMPYLEQKALY